MDPPGPSGSLVEPLGRAAQLLQYAEHQTAYVTTIMNKVSKNIKSLTSNDARVIAESNQYYLKTAKDFTEIITKMEAEISKLKQQVDDLQKEKTSYAAVARQQQQKQKQTRIATETTPRNNTDPLCTILVQPKLDQRTGQLSSFSSEGTKKALSTLSLAGTSVGIQAIRPASKKGVLVTARTRQEVDQLEVLIGQQMHNSFDVKRRELRNPTLSMLITGTRFAEKGSHEALCKEILLRNNLWCTVNDPVKVVHSYATKNGNTIAIIEVGPGIYERIKAMGSKLFVGWDWAKVREQDPVSQCYKCQKFGHKAKSCRFEIEGKPAKRCANCGGDHDVITGEVRCSAPPCCANCKDRTKYLKDRSRIKTDHKATDENCPVRISAVKRANELIRRVPDPLPSESEALLEKSAVDGNVSF